MSDGPALDARYDQTGMDPLLPHIRQHFDAMTQKLGAFVEHQVQVEAWFKGECLALATVLRGFGVIDAVDREVKVPTGRIDLSITMAGRRHLIELKHWLVGRQKDHDYSCQFYFGDKSTGCWNDVSKLAVAPSSDSRWLWLFMTRNPGVDDWRDGIAKFNQKFAPFEIVPASDPREFPEAYFLGIAAVKSPLML